MRTGRSDGGAGGLTLVASQIVEDDDVAGRERRDEVLLDPGGEGLAIDRSVQHQGGDDPIVAQAGQEGQRLPMPERSLAHQRRATWRPAAQPRHVGLDPGFVNEDQSARVQAMLMRFPPRPLAGRPNPILLARHQRFF